MKRLLFLIILILIALLFIYNRDQVEKTVGDIREIKCESTVRYESVKTWIKEKAESL